MKIFDNFLPDYEFGVLQTRIMHHQFPWFYIDHVSIPDEDGKLINDPQAVETDGLFHVLYDREFETESFTNEIVNALYQQIEIKLGFTADHLIRSRLSMKFPKLGFTENNYNLPHVDYYYPHDSIVYYINDSDGDTRIFNEEFATDQTHPTTMFTTKQRITPKANRLIWFNGFQYHTASNPLTTARRVIININLEPL
jgi:hypothetical protein